MSGRSRLARHLEGWEVGAIVVFIVATFCAVVIPRTAIPEGLPPVQVSRREIEEARRQNDDSVRIAEDAELPMSVQMLGARIRVLGRAEWAGDEKEVARARDLVGQAVAVARASPNDLAVLQGYQASKFASAYVTYLRNGTVSQDLVELGGGVLFELEQNGWFQSRSATPPHVDVVLATLYKRQFAELVGPDVPELAPTATERKVLIGYLLDHPPPARLGATGKDGLPGPFLLKRIDELVELDPAYPALYARGIVLFHMREFLAAAEAFDEFLQTSGDGPYRLRANNYLKASLELAEADL